ncbi:hypothetical protein TVAG_018200 [Trichomonas vaginalis G3]|uniref:Uncharacterized protein n=1 Tax=Trichomonas vaginalis (strain ATCC PRA-98 / G3) TaxID=412133 RepID=A2F9V6_TRIV3|nr:hypothetical protein TVAG_018200 [Trichomonas vaginalis G3]|eukprot:XP_001311214.1 hypothetical protein [Trichomonas vaginalis G3]
MQKFMTTKKKKRKKIQTKKKILRTQVTKNHKKKQKIKIQMKILRQRTKKTMKRRKMRIKKTGNPRNQRRTTHFSVQLRMHWEMESLITTMRTNKTNQSKATTKMAKIRINRLKIKIIQQIQTKKREKVS